MALKIVVLAKQVPDTRNVGKDAMTAEGTVNRAALPAIFNPEDLNALEQALRLKEQNPGSTVGILTMGPPRAGEYDAYPPYKGRGGMSYAPSVAAVISVLDTLKKYKAAEKAEEERKEAQQ